MAIIGVDISKYQPELTAEIVAQMIAAGVKFVYVRFSQGTSYRDGQAENSTRLLQAAGAKVGPYHFTTRDDASKQFANFTGAMGDFQFDLPPAMDCEAYTALAGRYLDLPIKDYGLLSITRANPKTVYLAAQTNPVKRSILSLIPASLYSYAYPTYSIVDSMGMKLKAWMAGQTKLTGFQFPVIYTNAGSGNVIFPTAAAPMANRYYLWVANWTTAPVPYLPKIWQGKPYYVWQDGVVDGTPYGISGDLDHDVWGDAVPFPGDEPEPPEPPPPPTDYIDVRVIYPDGRKYSGRLEKSDA